MQKPDLNLLPIVFALYDERNESRAARVLGMSQPAVSMALRKMRVAFNDPLFIRAPSGVTPTPRAHALVRAMRPLVQRLQEGLLAQETFDPRLNTRTFTMAMSDIGEMVFLPRLLERLRSRAPHCTIRSVSMPPDALARGLEQGEVDLAIGYFPDLGKRKFPERRLFTHHFACLLRAGHPRYAPRLSLEDFLVMEHAVVRAEGRTQEIFERCLERKKIRRKVVLLTPHFLGIPVVIARSDLVATVPHALAAYFARLSPELVVAMPPVDIAEHDLKQHWHRKFDNDPRNQWLRDQVTQLFNDDHDEWRSPEALPGVAAIRGPNNYYSSAPPPLNAAHTRARLRPPVALVATSGTAHAATRPPRVGRRRHEHPQADAHVRTTGRRRR